MLRERTRSERFVCLPQMLLLLISISLAVTLEGTVIHKSGLITGGKSTHGNNKKWDEKDVQGLLIDCYFTYHCQYPWIGLIRVRDTLLADQRELHQQKARGKSDENLISEISRLESLITVAKDDLVCHSSF